MRKSELGTQRVGQPAERPAQSSKGETRLCRCVKIVSTEPISNQTSKFGILLTENLRRESVRYEWSFNVVPLFFSRFELTMWFRSCPSIWLPPKTSTSSP